ncbi:MAG: TerC/Alx family metal homeostasis membrane protein [Chitinophagaceae bacterium]
MSSDQLTYLVFGTALLLALILDLGLLSKKSTTISIKKALLQTILWVILALLFFGFLFIAKGHVIAVEYLSAYLMEWSLSIDNIFLFILIFSFFGVKEKYYARALLIGILTAIALRILFIAIGIELISRFHWLLYVFGAVILFTGIKMFSAKGDEEQNLADSRIYKFLKRFFPLTNEEAGGKYSILKEGKRYYTNMFVVIIMLATTDIIFALDSIPAVFAISQNPLVVYTSNIFAVLGLRSLFFLLKGAVNKFRYLQQGIAVILIFIGLKMLAEIFDFHVPIYISLLVILVCIVASILYSMNKSDESEDEKQQKGISSTNEGN